MSSIVKIQAIVKAMNVRKKFKRQRIEYHKQMEIEHLRVEEEKRLKSQMNSKKAKSEAERLYKERLANLEHEVQAEENREAQETRAKKEQIEMAELRKNQPINDSEMVDDMFGFIDSNNDGQGGDAPYSFKVSWRKFKVL